MANISANPETATGAGTDKVFSDDTDVCIDGGTDDAPDDAPDDRINAFASIIGFDLSIVTAFLRRAPLRISPSKASDTEGVMGKARGPPFDGGGGG